MKEVEESAVVEKKEEAALPQQFQLTLVEKHAFKRALDELTRVNKEMQDVGIEIMKSHGFDSTHSIFPIDLDRGIVQFLTREQARQALSKQQG